MKKARIYTPTKNAMQSGRANIKYWLLEFEQDQKRFNYPITGWVGSKDMDQELNLYFDTREEAVTYAEKHGIAYEVIEPKQPKLILRSYAENFK